MQTYKEKVLKEWHSEDTPESNVLQPRTIETLPLFLEGYTHSKNLEVRLNGIFFILDSTIIQGPRISAEQLQRLWDVLITNTKLPGDQRAFFRFLRRILQERDWLDSRLVCQFFEEKIEKNHQIVNEISLDGFQCIQTMLLYVNEFENYINIIKQPQDDKGSRVSSDNGNIIGTNGSGALNTSRSFNPLSRKIPSKKNQTSHNLSTDI